MNQIEQTARSRAASLGLDYAGAATPQEAYAWLQADPNCVLLDVRTRAEWQWVGQPALAPTQYVQVEWNLASNGSRNPHFLAEVQAHIPAGRSVLLLCRSGARSHAAAPVLQAAGFQAFNILEGFEGDKDAAQHRNTVNGWRYTQLPWLQG
jgi:rhodanese-related sulfurtransferase